jgi:Domain of unknown function (DUF202)
MSASGASGDPGYVERTELAWDRSLLAMGAIGLVLLRDILPFERARPAAGWTILVLAGAMGLGTFAYRRHESEHGRPSRMALKLVSAATALIGLIALGLAVVA